MGSLGHILDQVALLDASNRIARETVVLDFSAKSCYQNRLAKINYTIANWPCGKMWKHELRSALDPKRHYKKSDSKSKTLPKYFQVGTVIESASDFFSGRLTKKERKETLANELLADHSLTKYRKRKIREIEEQKRPAGVEKWKTRVASHGSVRRTVGINEKSALFTFSERTVFVGSRDSYSVWFLKQFPGREPKNLVSHKHTEYTPK